MIPNMKIGPLILMMVLSACTVNAKFGEKNSDDEAESRSTDETEGRAENTKPMATCAGNPDDEVKPCFRLHLNGLSKIASKAKLGGLEFACLLASGCLRSQIRKVV